MELVPQLFLIILSLLVLFKFLMRNGRSNSINGHNPRPKLPPGPRSLPIIGSIHHLFGYLPPHRSLMDLATKYGPIMHLKLGEITTIVVSSPGAAGEVMKTHDLTFATRPALATLAIITYGYRDIVFAPYGDYWRQVRKICVFEMLTAKRVQSFSSIREEEVSKLVRSIYTASTTASPVNLSRALYALTNDITARAAVGNKCKDQQRLLSTITSVIEVAGGFSMADLYPSSRLVRFAIGMETKVKRIQREADQILESIIGERREANKGERLNSKDGEEEEDLLDVLLRLQNQGGLQIPITNNDIKAIILDVFTAGSETSSTTMEWAMSELTQSPEAMARVQSEVRKAIGGKGKAKAKEMITEDDVHGLNYLQLVIKETLRLHPPAPLIPRESMHDCRIDGYDIPAKARVLINVWAIGRDPHVWDDAERFKPERFEGSSVDFKGNNFEFIPFGAGRRICPGMLFGLMSIELALAGLLYYFDWKFPQGVEAKCLDMTESSGLTVRRRTDLHLLAVPHINSLQS